MNYGNVLPVTGGAGTMVAGHFLGLDDIIAAAIALVLFGITAYRYASRIGRGRTTFIIGAAALATGLAMYGHVAGLSWGHATAVALVSVVVVLAIGSRLQNPPRTRRAAA